MIRSTTSTLLSAHQATALLGAFATFFAQAGSAQEFTLNNIGQFPAPDNVQVRSISHDGATVAGNWRQGATTTGFVWSQAGGRTDLAQAPGSTLNAITGISGDGSILFGRFENVFSLETPHVQTVTGTPTQLPFPGGFLPLSSAGSALDASDDGSVIVGFVQDAADTSVAIWTRTAPMTYSITTVTDLPGGANFAIANGVSGDGTIVVGNADDNGDTVAFRWTSGTGLVSLGDLSAGGGFEITSSLAEKISQDGTTIVGYGTEGTVQRAMRWTQGTGMVALPRMDPTEVASHARDVSGDGSVIVGTSTITAGGGSENAFRWTESTGTQRLADLLTEQSVDLTNTELTAAATITPDGRIIAGNARVDFGMGPEDTGFIAVYDETTATDPESSTSTTPTAGVIFPRDFSSSAGSISNASRFAGNALDIASDGLMFQGLNAPMGSGPGFSFVQAPARIGGFVFGQGQQLLGSAPDQATTGSGGAAVTYDIPGGLMIGAGPLALRHNFTSSTLGSTAGISGLGAGVFLRYSPAITGIQVMATATALSLDADINRNYLNGGAVETARGSTKGSYRGVKARFGYGLGVAPKTVVTPFTAVSWGRSEFDGYTEAGPLFAGLVSAQSTERRKLELGAEVRHKVNAKLEVSGALSVTHARETSNFAQLSVPVLVGATFGGGAGSRNYNSVKAEIGVNFAVSENVSVNGALTVNKGLAGVSDLDDATLTLGMSFRF